MTYMSCEAVTAGLVLTGLVHADPHEGNIMLADDGRLVNCWPRCLPRGSLLGCHLIRPWRAMDGARLCLI